MSETDDKINCVHNPHPPRYRSPDGAFLLIHFQVSSRLISELLLGSVNVVHILHVEACSFPVLDKLDAQHYFSYIIPSLLCMTPAGSATVGVLFVNSPQSALG